MSWTMVSALLVGGKNTDHMNWASWIYNNVLGAPLLLTGYKVYWLKQAIYREYSLAFFRHTLKAIFSR